MLLANCEQFCLYPLNMKSMNCYTVCCGGGFGYLVSIPYTYGIIG